MADSRNIYLSTLAAIQRRGDRLYNALMDDRITEPDARAQIAMVQYAIRFMYDVGVLNVYLTETLQGHAQTELGAAIDEAIADKERRPLK